MVAKTSPAFFNEPVLRGWCGFWIAPQPHRLGGPQARITRVVSTGDFSWPHAGTFTWPRTEWDYCGEERDARTRGAMLDEHLELRNRLWTGQPVRHEGRFYRTAGPGW